MTELSERWDSLSDAEQSNISFAIAATRQTATLRAVLQNWAEAMNLATEATDAEGNALAHQQEYVDSLAGHMQSLKTEMSALWMELLSSDTIKTFIDSIKELIVSLEDGVTGLKPIVDFLANLLSIVTKILSIIPPGGLIASVIGLKYGSAITKFFRNIIYDLTSTTRMFGAATVAATAFDKVLLTIKANKFGLITIAITGIITLFNALYTSTEELEQKFDELSQKIEASETKIKSLNEELESQKKIIDDINSNPLDAVSAKQLQNAIDLTAQLERQLELEKLKKRTESEEAIETKIALWEDEGYVIGDSIKNAIGYLGDYFLNVTDATPLTDDELKKKLVSYDNELASAKSIYDSLSEAEEWTLYEDEKKFKDYYERIKQQRDAIFRKLNSDAWNRTEVTSIFGKENIQEELNGISEGLDEWASKNQYLVEHGYFSPIDEIINQIKSGDYPEVMDAINEAVFSENLNDDQKIEVFAKEYFKKIKDKFAKVSKSGEQYQSIDLSSWLKQTSDVESDKTWDDILDSYESGLNSLGDLLKKWKSGNEVITTKDIFDVTDVKDSIFQKLGMDSFNSYLDKFGDNIEALNAYIQDSFTALIENVDNPELIEGFDIVIEKLLTLMNVASGGADNIDKLDTSYKELIDLYERVKRGERLTTEEAANMIDKYGALQDAVKVTSDGYSFEQKALVNLINQYIEFSNEAIAAEIRTTKETIEATRIRIQSRAVEEESLRRIYNIYNAMLNSGTPSEKAADSIKNLFGVDINHEVFKDIAELLEYEGKLKELYEAFEDMVKDRQKYDIIANGTEIDWIANSLDNIANKVDKVQSKYDRLLTTFGSKKALKTANAGLENINKSLKTQASGFKKAAESYEKEFNSLGLSENTKKLIKNAVTTGEGWNIIKYASEDAEIINKGIDLYKKIQENLNSEAETKHKIITNEIQELQNISDYYDARIATKEAKLEVTANAKTQQKILTNLISLYREQYAAQIAIANENGEELKVKQLIYEEEAKIAELEVQRAQAPIDAITKKYERIASEFENRQAILEHNINMTEAKGYMGNVNYYRALIDNEMDTINSNLKERDKLLAELATINPDSEGMLDLWWETKEQIDGVTTSLYESEEALVEWQNAIDNINYDVFQRIQDIISGINDESKFLSELFDENKLFKYEKEIWGKGNRPTKVYYGGFSDEGLAVLGLHQLQIKTNTELAENYAKKLAEVNKKLAKDPANTQLLDKRNELLSLQRDQIEATEAEKDAIIDLVREGYDKQLSSLEELISKYTDALQAEKDLYSYQKSISDKTKDIAKTRKMLAAYATDTSEEARSRIQQLNVQLKESEEDLRSAQWDHYLSEQKDILDEMYETFEQYINDKMENRDAILEDVATMVDNNFNDISKTLSNKADSVGTNLTNSMKNMWSTPISQISTIQEKISTSDANISAIENSVNDVLPGLKTYLANYNKDTDEIINGQDKPLSKIQKKIDKLDTAIDINNRLKVDNDSVVAELGRVIEAIEGLNVKNSGAIAQSVAGITNYNPTQTLASNSQVSNNIQGSGTNNTKSSTGNGSADFFVYQKYAGDKSKLNKETSIVDRLLYNDIYIGKSPNDLTQRAAYYAGMGFTGVYTGSTAQNQMMIDWMRKHNYAKGARRISKNELAWTQENGVEAIIRPADGAILTPLAKNDAVLNSMATQNIWDMANNPLQFIKDNLSIPNLQSNINGGNYDIQQSLMITLPSVKNYSEFVTALQNDKRFEQMIQDMTINQLDGKKSLAKYKYKY